MLLQSQQVITALCRQSETISQSLHGGMCVTGGQFHHTGLSQATITAPGSAGLQGMTVTVKKLEHQLQHDGNTLLPKHEDGQILHCTVTTALAALAAAAGEGQSQSPLLTATAPQVQEKEVHSAAFHHLQKHKNSMGCLQIENGLCQELSKAVVATGIIGLCQLQLMGTKLMKGDRIICLLLFN